MRCWFGLHKWKRFKFPGWEYKGVVYFWTFRRHCLCCHREEERFAGFEEWEKANDIKYKPTEAEAVQSILNKY